LLMLLQGLSVGFGQQVPVIGVQNAANAADLGAATGAVTLTRMAGASIAISIYGATLAAFVTGQGHSIPGVASIEGLTPAELAMLPEQVRALVATVYTDAFQPVFLSMAGMIALGLLAALSLKNVRLQANTAKAG
ncbi:MAG: MFS transporter, partial [Proteobacteria bacterium]|nr:MFS transporter [Pseudomonadota bacterium]